MRTIVALIGVLMAGSAFAAKSNRCAEVPGSVAEYDKSTQKFKGCRLTAVEKDSVHGRLGLKVGDIVKPSAKYKVDRDAIDLELVLSKTDEVTEPAAHPRDCSRYDKVPAEGCVDNHDEFREQ